MTTAFGLTELGLYPPTLADIRADITARILKTISPTLDLSDRTAEGQIVGIVSERLASVWEQLEVVIAQWDPDKATGAFLAALAALTGTVIPLPSKSAVTLTLTGVPTSVVPSGDAARVGSDGPQFATTSTGTIDSVPAWVTTTAYSLADRVTGSGNVYQCTTAGTSGGSVPSSGDVAEDIVDGTVHWRFLGIGTGAIDVPATCTVVGPNTANSGTITSIVNPESGWDGVINVLDATVGRSQLTDANLRVLRVQELAEPGTGTVDAIRAALLSVLDVTAATVFENTLDTTVDGIPPHSIEAMIQGGVDQTIADVLLANTGAGIRCYGSTFDGFSADSQGISHSIQFTRPSPVLIYVAITLVVDTESYPSNGDTQVKQAIVDYGDVQKTGRDAVSAALAAQAFKVDGVLDVTATLIGTAPSPTLPTTIAIGLRQLAVYDTSRVTVTTSPGTP